MKYPIGIQSFEKIRNEGFVYVDKTDLIYSLVNEGKPTISGYKLWTNVYKLDFPNDDARCSIQALEAIMAASEKCS